MRVSRSRYDDADVVIDVEGLLDLVLDELAAEKLFDSNEAPAYEMQVARQKILDKLEKQLRAEILGDT